VNRLPDDLRQTALSMLHAGLRAAAIAKVIGVSTPTVHNWRREHARRDSEVVLSKPQLLELDLLQMEIKQMRKTLERCERKMRDLSK